MEALSRAVPKALFRASVIGGTGGAPRVTWRYDVSPEGQRFLLNTTLDEDAGAPINAVLNWRSLLNQARRDA